MDLTKSDPDNLVCKAKVDKYTKIISRTIILFGRDGTSYGQKAFFYDEAEEFLLHQFFLYPDFVLLK